MKILFVINQLVCGGAEQQLVTLCEGLKSRGHQLAVISIYDHLDLRGRLDAIQVPVAVAYKYSKLDLTVVWRLRRLIKQVNPDLVHAYLPASCLFTAMTKWLGVNLPIVQAERSVNRWRGKWRLWLDNRVRRKVAHIVCNAKAIRKHLVETERVPWQKITVIYNGLAPERRARPSQEAVESVRKQLEIPAGSFVVTCLANFVAEKQHDILLQAFAQAKQRASNLFLVLVGKGELEETIRKWINQLRLGEVSRMICNCNDPLPLLCASDAAILTSWVEGCSNALLEAMAMGLPIIATDAGGNSELVADGAGGIICPVGDVASLADALVRLASHPAHSDAMRVYNLERVKQKFTADRMLERTMALYERVLNEAKNVDKHSRLAAGLKSRRDRDVRDRRMVGDSTGQ